MEIQQHDGVVVDVAGCRQGFAEHIREREMLQGEREAPKAVGCCPPSPPLYRPPGGAPALEMRSPKGGGGQGGWSAPQGKWAPPTLGFPTLGAGGPKGGRTSPPGAGSPPTSAMGPSGMGGPTRWTPGTLSVVPVQYR